MSQVANMPVKSILVMITLALIASLPGCAGGLRNENGASGVRPGLEVFLASPPEQVLHKRVGLITNHTGIDRERRRNIDLLAARQDFDLVALFAFEHGLRGEAPPGEKIVSDVDPSTALPVYSLYGEVRKPTPEMLEDIDVLIYDVQDVGARPYTRVSTMALSMQAAAEAGIPFVLLDRPNPLGGLQVEGGRLDTAFSSFVGMYPIPLRHGMTLGELARMYNTEFDIDADLTVVPMQGWRRAMWHDATGLPWVSTSPNIRSLDAATHYPGMVLLEGTNLSEGRGTDLPFEQTGAPWLRNVEVVDSMNAKGLPGVRFEAVQFEVDADALKYSGESLPGIRFMLTDRDVYRPVSTALLLIDTIRRLHDDEFEWGPSIDRLAGTDSVRQSIDAGVLHLLLKDWEEDAELFKRERESYLMYE